MIERGNVTLVAKKGIVYKGFPALCEQLSQTFGNRELIFGGEIACIDGQGKSQFYSLMFRRAKPVFCAFDVLWSGGKDLRHLPLRKLIPQSHSHLLFVDHTEDGQGVYDLVCANDLEGVVIKPKSSAYANDRWLKVPNPGYSQKQDRHELFEKTR